MVNAPFVGVSKIFGTNFSLHLSKAIIPCALIFYVILKLIRFYSDAFAAEKMAPAPSAFGKTEETSEEDKNRKPDIFGTVISKPVSEDTVVNAGNVAAAAAHQREGHVTDKTLIRRRSNTNNQKAVPNRQKQAIDPAAQREQIPAPNPAPSVRAPQIDLGAIAGQPPVQPRPQPQPQQQPVRQQPMPQQGQPIRQPQPQQPRPQAQPQPQPQRAPVQQKPSQPQSSANNVINLGPPKSDNK